MQGGAGNECELAKTDTVGGQVSRTMDCSPHSAPDWGRGQGAGMWVGGLPG